MQLESQILLFFQSLFELYVKVFYLNPIEQLLFFMRSSMKILLENLKK